MDVHPTKNGINRYWSIPMYQTGPRVIGCLSLLIMKLCKPCVYWMPNPIVAHCPIMKHQSSQRALDIHSWWLSQLFTIHHMMSHDFRVHRTSSWLANVSYLASWIDFTASSSRIPTPAMACRNPGPQPCRIPQQKHSRKNESWHQTVWILCWFCLWCLYMLMLFSDFMWFHFSRCFQMFSFCSGKWKSTPSDWGWPHRARAEHCRHRSCWSPMCHMCHVAKYRGISQTNPFGIL